MKLVEIQPTKYNSLAITEPGSSFYQTVNWGDFYSRLGYTSIYLGYVDKTNVYSALGLFIIKKSGSLFGKKTAICPFGYLINYYDTKLLKDFTTEVKKFLSRKGVSELTINPNIAYTTSRGNNDLLIRNICNIGYQKTKANIYYTNKIKELPEIETADDICLKTYVVDSKEDSDKLFKASENYKHLYHAMGKLVKFVVCELDASTSITNLNASIFEAKDFIEAHKDDYTYDAERSEKEKIVIEKQNMIDVLNKHLSENDNNSIIAVTCFIEFNKKLTVLFTDDKKELRVLNTLEILNAKALETINKLGYESFDSYTENKNSQKIELIGEFTYHIK